MANLEQALEICRRLEAIAPDFGCHVALTGGTLYKDGERKDVDILFYKIRQEDCMYVQDLLRELETKGFEMGYQYGWVFKAKFYGLI